MKERILRNTLRTVVCTIIGAYTLLLGILNFSPTEQALTHYIAQELSRKLGTEVVIENIEVGLFNRLTLNGVEIKDKKAKNLLKAQHVSAKIELRSLLKSQLALRTVSLLDTHIELYKEKADSAANYQFLIDAFSTKDNKEVSALNLRINSIILRRVSVAYNENYQPQTLGTFNSSHLNLQRLNANISLKSITNEAIDLRIRSLSFAEESGLKLDQLTLKLKADKKHAELKDFYLKLPHSKLTQSYVTAHYDLSKGLGNLGKTLTLDATLNKAILNTADIRPLIKKFPNKLNETLTLSGKFRKTPHYLQVQSLAIDGAQHYLSLLANAKVTKRDQSGHTQYALTLKQLSVKQPLINQLPAWVKTISPSTQLLLSQLGDIHCSGQFSYSESGEGHTSLVLETAIGKVATDGKIRQKQVTANVQLTDAQPDVLLNNKNLPTHITLRTHLQANLQNKKQLEVQSKSDIETIQWKDYAYRNIHLNADYNPQALGVEVHSNDPNALLSATANIALNNKKIAKLKAEAFIKHLAPQNLGIHSFIDKAQLSGHIQANLTPQAGSLPKGKVKVNHLELTNGKYGDYQLEELCATLHDVDKDNQQLSLQSDFASLSLLGDLSVEKITEGVKSILQKNLPGLIRDKQNYSSNKEWQINAQVKSTDILYKLLGVKIGLTSPLDLKGILCTGSGRTYLTAYTDQMSFGSQVIDHPSIYINGQDSTYQCLVQAHKRIADRDYSISADLSTQEGTLLTHVGWRANNYSRYNGEFKSLTYFLPNNGNSTNFKMHILPTQFALADTLWNIASGSLSYINKELSFSGVKLSHLNQSLQINGHVAPHKNDSIVAELNHIDIDYVLGLINFDAVAFGGQATGTAVFTQQSQTPQLHAKLRIPDFTFNNGEMGDTEILASWNKKENRINLDAKMHLAEGNNHDTNVKGYVLLEEKGLLLDIEAKHTQLKFLRRYIDGIFGNFNGEATGKVRLYGPFKALDFDGKVTADCQAKVLSTGVDYRVSEGEVVMSQGEFAFHNFKITDKLGGTGNAEGVLNHTHLKNLNYHFDLKANKLLCYDLQQSTDMPFYSHTIGTGSVSLKGWPEHFTTDIMLSPDAKTTFTYDLGTQSTLSKDDDMIRFHAINETDSTLLRLHSLKKKEALVESQKEKTTKEGESSTDIVLNFFLNVNPAAQLRIITDSRAGDAITVYGNGALRASWHNKGNFDIYGTYTIDHGEYKISLQDIIRKNLTLQQGSSITFTGEPLNASLDLKALYTVNGVSLNDLNYTAGFSNKTVRADCILNIDGKANNPQVNFDFDLHNISEDEKQMVRQLISTEEDMSKQVVCLLGMGRFLTSTSSNAAGGNNTGQQQSTAAMRSLVSTTLTGQLNTAISSILGTQSKWNFGTNFNPGDESWNNLEVDGLLQGRLFNDRLLINGNFGYRNKPTYTSNFVGDFDIRYLLTPRGSISLRAYNETNDRYFTKSSLNTQGVGLMLQHEFNNLRELFRRKNKQKAKNN